ncbi:MAG TPA: dTMP kinase [Verrucomicrobiae bacterium]|nr:dTMP kinase [Verrucomicrobiae bacterium]
MAGLFITFEGTEGCGKSTQLALLADRLRTIGHTVRTLREPGGTAIGEEIRHTLKHSPANHGMTPEAELLLLNASRAQLVREVIRPALASGEIVLCDRFLDSTIVYQGHGRQLDLGMIRSIIDLAVGGTRPTVTLLLRVSQNVSEARQRARAAQQPVVRDRFEEADRSFFSRVELGYDEIARAERERIRIVEANQSVEAVAAAVWTEVERFLKPPASA